MVQQVAFGVDFGTTNTRVAYYDGRKLQMIPIFDERGGTSYSLPTAVAYEDGRPVAFGRAALDGRRGALPPQSIKWLLDRGKDEPVEVDGRPMEPAAMAADFFGHLRTLVSRAVPSTPMDRIAVTIPVHFPPRAARTSWRAAAGRASRWHSSSSSRWRPSTATWSPVRRRGWRPSSTGEAAASTSPR